MVTNVHPISAAFFCPRARRPRDDYVSRLRSFLGQRTYGISILDHVSRLPDAWPFFAEARADIRNLPHSQQNLDLLVAWSKGGPVGPVCETTAGLVALPLLLVLQLGQYLRYLEVHNVSHESFLRQVQHGGGIHGFCGGAAAALCIACAKDEAEVIENAAVFLPVMMGLGAAMDAAGDWESGASTTIAVRLRHEGQGEELLEQLSGVSKSNRLISNIMLIRFRHIYQQSRNQDPSVSWRRLIYWRKLQFARRSSGFLHILQTSRASRTIPKTLIWRKKWSLFFLNIRSFSYQSQPFSGLPSGQT
jgi:hypothetical protein